MEEISVSGDVDMKGHSRFRKGGVEEKVEFLKHARLKGK